MTPSQIEALVWLLINEGASRSLSRQQKAHREAVDTLTAALASPSPATAEPTREGARERGEVEDMGDGDGYRHSPKCQGGCDYSCAGYFICGRCGGTWNGTPAFHECAAPAEEEKGEAAIMEDRVHEEVGRSRPAKVGRSPASGGEGTT